MVLGMGAHFFGLKPRLWSVRVFKVVPRGIENVGAVAESLTRGYPHRSIQLALGDIGTDGPERSELGDAEFERSQVWHVVVVVVAVVVRWVDNKSGGARGSHLKELIHVWNRYCPVLREIQLKVGYVWRRAGPVDAWTQRSTKVTRPGNAGFEDV